MTERLSLSHAQVSFSKDVPIQNLGTCECCLPFLHSKRDSTDEAYLRIFRWEDDPGLSEQAEERTREMASREGLHHCTVFEDGGRWLGAKGLQVASGSWKVLVHWSYQQECSPADILILAG